MAAIRHFEFAKFWSFVVLQSLEPKSAAARQISLKSDDPRLRYGDETIFKMAAVRHLEFSKIAIFVTWVRAWFYQISRQSDNNSWRYSQKTIFSMAAVRHFQFHVCFVNQHVTVLGTKIWVCTPNFIEIGWFPAENLTQWKYIAKNIFKMAAVRHLEFSKLGILVTRAVSERDSASSRKISR